MTKTITIRDCDGDDPTCEEYYGLQGKIGNPSSGLNIEVKETEFNAEYSEIESRNLIVFDLFGNKLELKEIDAFREDLNINQILIFTYWDKHGNFIESRKVFIH